MTPIDECLEMRKEAGIFSKPSKLERARELAGYFGRGAEDVAFAPIREPLLRVTNPLNPINYIGSRKRDVESLAQMAGGLSVPAAGLAAAGGGAYALGKRKGKKEKEEGESKKKESFGEEEEMETTASASPLDEAIMSKEAFLGGFLKKSPGFLGRLAKSVAGEEAVGALGKQILTGGGLALGGAAAMAAIPAVTKVRNAMSRTRDFRNMMQLNPDLSEERQRDPRFFVASYNSLRRFNPSFGRDPVVSGAYMRKMMQNPDVAGLTLAQTVSDQGMPGETKVTVGPFQMQRPWE